MATSGRSRRHWRQGGQPRHHLLDPRTGASVETSLWSVTAVAGGCAQAEIAAKVTFVLGADAGAAHLDAQGLAGLFVEGERRMAGGGRLAHGDESERLGSAASTQLWQHVTWELGLGRRAAPTRDSPRPWTSTQAASFWSERCYPLVW